jgi:hypothetical protein
MMNDEKEVLQMSPVERSRNLMDRTKQFALRVIRMYCALPKSKLSDVLGHQVLRSGTSV